MSKHVAQTIGGKRTCPHGNEFCANAPGNDEDTHIECLSCYTNGDGDEADAE